MIVIIGLVGFAGVVLFGVLYVLFFFKGASLKLPILGMALFTVIVIASGVLAKLGILTPDSPDDGEPSQAVESQDPDAQGSSAPTEGGDSSGDGDPLSQEVLLDKRGIVITATGLDKDGSFGPELKMLIENNSESDVTVQARGVSVNGYMVDTVFSVDVPAGKKANDALTFLSSGLQKCGIETIADIEFTFHIIDSSLTTTFLDSDPVQLTTAAADSYQYSFDDSGDELYNADGVRIVSKGFSEDDSVFGPGLVLFLENTTDQAITVQARSVSVNGYMVDVVFSADVMPGKRSVTSVTVTNSSLESNGIERIQNMQLSFHVLDSGMGLLFDTDLITVRPG